MAAIFLILLMLVLGASSFSSFEPQCTSPLDYGWPRFESREELLAQKNWTSYFIQVYGELPTLYPVCVFDLWWLDTEAYERAGFDRQPIQGDPVKNGDLFHGALGYGIYHEQWKPLPNDTWVEVSHTVYPTEMEGMWVWRTRGSGIWVNTGRTLVFPSPADPSKTHAEAIAFLRANCSCDVSFKWPQMESDLFGCCAREKGYDSVQFEPQDGEVPLGTFGVTGLTEMVVVNMNGNLTCGVSDARETHLRAGWRASQKCKCTNQDIPATCGIMAYSPLPAWMTSPPLCQVQAEDPSQACLGLSCGVTSCMV